MDKSAPAPLKPRTVVCPGCGGASIYAANNLYRPFCSERCKNLDLGAWASENFRVAADMPLDELSVDDTRLQ